MPENESESTPQPEADSAAPQLESAEPQPVRAPLPGEPGFKAPLTAGQLKRMNQTIKGMVISVLLTFAVVLPIIFLNPGSTKETYEKRIDAQEIAQQSVTVEGFKAVAPDFPKDFYANKAQWNPGAADGVGYWELGIVGKLDGEEHYVRMLQAQKVNASWVSLATDGSVPTGESVTVDSTTWQVRQQPGAASKKTVLTATLDGYTFILTGDRDDDAFMKKAADLVQTAETKADPVG
ncbi:MAG: DUF4245 family protein [Galactobacter sp.]